LDWIDHLLESRPHQQPTKMEQTTEQLFAPLKVKIKADQDEMIEMLQAKKK
jgi:hypothetical protein